MKGNETKELFKQVEEVPQRMNEFSTEEECRNWLNELPEVVLNTFGGNNHLITINKALPLELITKEMRKKCIVDEAIRKFFKK